MTASTICEYRSRTSSSSTTSLAVEETALYERQQGNGSLRKTTRSLRHGDTIPFTTRSALLSDGYVACESVSASAPTRCWRAASRRKSFSTQPTTSSRRDVPTAAA
ncbi:hypothetical protein BC567DRAFT_229860 [Phyllosticta citribraziliensis]